MKAQNSVQKQGFNDFKNGVSINRNPYQYTSNIFKQAAWLLCWRKAEKERDESN